MQDIELKLHSKYRENQSKKTITLDIQIYVLRKYVYVHGATISFSYEQNLYIVHIRVFLI